MPRIRLVVLLLVAASLATAGPEPRPSAGRGAGAGEGPLARLPLSFVENRGQADDDVRYIARAEGHSFFLTDEALVVATAGGRSVRVRFASDHPTTPTGRAPQAARFNYFLGNDPAGWTTDVPGWGEVAYEGLLPGVDLVYRGDHGRVKYEFVVAPGANPASIHLIYEGTDGLTLRGDGAIDVRLGDEILREERPVVFQREDGVSVPVKAAYRIERLGEAWKVSFDLGDYDPSLPLVIDPVLAYSSYHGGNESDWTYGFTTDAAGNLYVSGETGSADFPTTPASYRPTPVTAADGYVYKLDPTGSVLLFGTYIGGTGTDDAMLGVQLDAAGNLCMSGWTNSADFPTVNPIQATYGGGSWDAILVKLSADGSTLLASSYLGGTADDWTDWMELDAAGSWYLNGNTNSTDFPTASPMQPANGGSWDLFVAKVNPAVSTLVYSTYVGGSGDEYSWWTCIRPDSAGGVFASGYTNSADFPTRNPRQAANAGGWDAVLFRLNAAGSDYVFSTYLGGTGGDFGYALDLDVDGNIVFCGETGSADFPVVNAIQGTIAGEDDVFVSRIDPTGANLLSSTFFGGAGTEWPTDLQADRFGILHLVGTTNSRAFPTRYAPQATLGGGWDAFATRFDGAMTRVLSSTYLGGTGNDYAERVAAGQSGDTWVLGETSSLDFPTVSPRQLGNAGGWDGFVSHLVPSAAEVANEVVVGLDSYPSSGGWSEVLRDGLGANAPDAWVRLDHAPYNSANGETHPACGDVDGDGFDEIVVGYGKYTPDGGWMAVFDDRAAGHALIRWILLPWRAYDRANGAVWPACGDLDDDGADEIVAGLGSYPASGGCAFVFDDGRHGYEFVRLLRLPWSAYNAANGETRVACGDLDGDRREEIVVATGTYAGAGGFWGVFEDMASSNAFVGWQRMGWAQYNAADGQLWPACGDVDGDGLDEVLLGTGRYPASGGWVSVRDDALAGHAPLTWIRVPWAAYNGAVGETRPACGDIEGDGLDEVLVGLGPYPSSGGFTWVAEDSAGAFATVRWARVPWAAYNGTVGATRPAAGNLGD
ncbi:MAG: SBBP repeat-containing protein [Planctomycetota bacterium]